MLQFDIGIRGIQIAQKAIELIGTNMANAGTEGYHRQELSVAPMDFGSGGRLIGGNTDPSMARRQIDRLLDQEIMRQQPLAGQVQQELESLESIQGVLGGLDTEGLGTGLDHFFNSLMELSSDPNSAPLQQQVVGAAESLITRFHTLSSFLQELTQNLQQEAAAMTAQVNSLTDEVAMLNQSIAMSSGLAKGADNVLRDRRDQAISELSKLVDVTTDDRSTTDGVVNVNAWGMPMVVRDKATQLEVGKIDELLGVSIEGTSYYQTDIRGGRLGGLLSLYNEILPRISGQLDSLARGVMSEVNAIHVQGIGSSGSFTQLTGTTGSELPLDQSSMPVSSGTFYIRTIDQATGEVLRQAVTIDASTDTQASMAAKVSAMAHISAEIVDGRFMIQADDGYRFDFLGGVLPEPTGGNYTGTATPTISGVYTGTDDETYTAVINGTGQVGVTQGLTVDVRDGSGALVRRIDIGAGYAAGDRLTIADGISIAFGSGSMTAGEHFDIQAIADMDPTNFLAVAGLNVIFTGDSAATIALREDLADKPSLLSCAAGDDGTDNINVTRLAQLGQARLAALGDVSPQEYYRQIAVGVGLDVATREARTKAMEQVHQQLLAQRDTVSGVDINTESAKLLMFERMFQAMSRYVSTQDKAMSMLLEMM